MSSSAVRAAVLAAMLTTCVPPALAAQTPEPLWKRCAPPESAAAVTLGSRTIAWTDVQAPGPDEIELGSTLPPRAAADRQAAPAASRADAPPAPPAERILCLVPSPETFPNERASQALVLIVAASTDLMFLRVEIYRESRIVVSSDGAAAQHSMLIASRPISASAPAPPADGRVFVVVSRADAGSQSAKFRAWIQPEPLAHDARFEDGQGWFVRSLSEGHAFRYVTDATSYNGLLRFARCDWVSHDARRTESPAAVGSPDTAPDAGCFGTQMAALKKEIYPLVSSLTGRSVEREFLEGLPRASLSEPMVVFFGLGGTNRILLLDCRDISTDTEPRVCREYAEPWQTTLQRARYVWAVYIEDEQTPFNTSIDVEFKSRAPSVDYEEYDPLGLAYPQVALSPPAGGGARVLRIGYRRLRIREPPVAVQIAFSRVGPNYGLRQWVRVYRQFSARWWVVSGAVFVPADNNAIAHIELERVFPLGGGPAVSARIVDDRPPAPIFATLVWRWPQVRGLAENQAQANRRLIVNLIPDAIVGISLPPRRHNSYLAGGSWPILADRVSFVIGAKIFRDEQPTEGYAVGQFVPVDTAEAQVRSSPRRHVGFLFGLAIELVRSR